MLFLPCSQFCGQVVKSRGAFCRQHSGGSGGGTASSLRVIEGNRKRMVVDVRLENKGENAYNARLNITYTPNLRFSSLVVKVPHRRRVNWHTPRLAVPSTDFCSSLCQDTSDIKIDCSVEDKLRTEKICNVSAPFMRAKSQVRCPALEAANINLSL